MLISRIFPYLSARLFPNRQNQSCFDQTNNGIDYIVRHETYAMIESPSVEDVEMSDTVQNDKFARLGKLLDEHCLPRLQIIGSYEGIKTKYSYFVVMPKTIDLTKFRQIIFNLGKEFKQESVIISSKGYVELVYTTGVNAGVALTGYGFNANISKNYSEIPTKDKKSFFIGEYYLDRQKFIKWQPSHLYQPLVKTSHLPGFALKD